MASNAYHRGKRVSVSHAAMLAAYERETGRPVYINQGRRTIAEQTGFWLHYLRYGSPLAARPFPGAPHIKYGRENHAMDINAPQPAHAIADFYRKHNVPVAFNVPREPWHMDTLDEAALKRAVAKLGGATGDPTLKQGQVGPSVVKLKKLLYSKGVRAFSNNGGNNRYDPFFSKFTKSAVIRFQRANKLTADGVVGKGTWAALRK